MAASVGHIRTMACLYSVPKRSLMLCLALVAATLRWGLPGLGFVAPRGLDAARGRRGSLGQAAGPRQNARRGQEASAQPLAPLCGVGVLAAGLASCAGRRRRRARAPSGAPAPGSVARSAASEKKERKRTFQEDIDWSQVSTEWEVDCFSRPVMADGKKMWELMVTDANAVYRRVAQMKPTRVNSVVVQKLLTIFIEESKVKPRVIRFYRKVMKNMLTVALNTVKDSTKYMENVKIIPSRNCHMLRTWLSWREREVYPKMDGYMPMPARRTASVQASMVQMSYEPLPERLRISRYAISAIPLNALMQVKPGQLPGSLCRVPPGFSPNSMVHGLVILTTRDKVMCSLLSTLEVAAMRVNLDSNELVIDLGIDTTYLVNKVPTEDREGCVQLERAKRELGGLHFIAVHNPVTGGEPNLPIQADDMGPGPGCISGLWLCIDYSPVDK
uniref:Uncharacterized protein n=1 Tax=Alexandrium catenella TaxID=2925 RepID=A0A7S1S538_ALECA|mmetsp:Transcript_86616/g.230075  ORF Transcript_86616/g.230075 Transcript_86616/m.230075 type:complete len:444 (+) Transcript_86616:68-1399(+)